MDTNCCFIQSWTIWRAELLNVPEIYFESCLHSSGHNIMHVYSMILSMLLILYVQNSIIFYGWFASFPHSIVLYWSNKSLKHTFQNRPTNYEEPIHRKGQQLIWIPRYKMTVNVTWWHQMSRITLIYMFFESVYNFWFFQLIRRKSNTSSSKALVLEPFLVWFRR